MKKYVKCINQTDDLLEGQTYEVLNEDPRYFTVIALPGWPDGGRWWKHRFVEVPAPAPAWVRGGPWILYRDALDDQMRGATAIRRLATPPPGVSVTGGVRRGVGR